MAVALGHTQYDGSDVLGQAVGQALGVGVQHLGHAGDGGGLLGGWAGVVAGHEDVDFAAGLEGGGDGVEGGAADAGVVVFGDDECGHGQITLASFLSLATRVATSGTLMPALRLGGSLTLRVLMRGATSTPRSAGLSSSSGFFLAFMMLGRVT